ncbi:hypothetical protein BH20ACT19_BH20ACT19_03000 [soil metagenome]
MRENLTIRLSREDDALALGRLAQLDSTLYDGSQVLLAEDEVGHVLAAVLLGGGGHFADPFEHTTEVLALLELRLMQIERALSGSRRAGRTRRGYRAPASA